MIKKISVYQTGRHQKHRKVFSLKTSLEDLQNHFIEYVDSINLEKFDNPRALSVAQAKTLSKEFMIQLLSLENDKLEFREISKIQIKDALFAQGLIHPVSKRPQSGRVDFIFIDINNIIYFWFFVAATKGLLESESCWPPTEIQPATNLLGSGILKDLNDIEILSIFCSTKEGLQRAKSLGLFSETFEPVIDLLCEAYSTYQSRNNAVYKSSASYVLREYIISGQWNKGTIDANRLHEIKKELTILSKTTTYSTVPVDEFLVKIGMLSLNGEVIDHDEYLDFINSNFAVDEAYKKELAQRKPHAKYKSFDVNHDSRLIRLNFQLGRDYPTEKYGILMFRDLIADNLFFTVRKPYKDANHRIFTQHNSYSETGSELVLFSHLFEIQQDYLQAEGSKKQKSTMKGLKSSMADLNEYLCGYLFEFATESGYEFLDCSGDNFLNVKLSIAFNDSKIIERMFERDFGLKVKPVRYNVWLSKKKYSSDVMNRKIRHAIDFFDYCEKIASHLNIKFVNPMLGADVKSNNLSYKQTTKEVFGYVEWLIWTELISSSTKAIAKNYKNELGSQAYEPVEKKLVDGSIFNFIKSHYKLDISLTENMVKNAINAYEYQYDNIWGQRVSLDSPVFITSLLAILVMVNSGLRSHSAANLPFDDLVIERSNKYSAIKVVADKVDPNGFISHLPNEVLDRLLEYREIIKLNFPSSFKKKREIQQPGGENFFIDGLFGGSTNCNEDLISVVADFFFYLFNELVKEVNNKLGKRIVSEIPVLIMPRREKRGVGADYRKKNLKEDIYTLSLTEAIGLPAVLLEKNAIPAISVVQRPNRTVHSFRASLVTNMSLAGIGPEVIKLLTGQEAPTVSHYTKATKENLKILEMQGILGLATEAAKGTTHNIQTKSLEEIQDFVKQGIGSSGGMACSFGDAISKAELDNIYKRSYKHIAIHSTHICPYNDECPNYIDQMFEGHKDCAICPVSVSFLTDLPAISMKIKFHFDEAKLFQTLANEESTEYKKKEYEGLWIKHTREASMWLARYDLLTHNGVTVAGARIIRDSKDILIEFRCEDNQILDRLLEVIESRGHYQYQSEDLKGSARMMQLLLAANMDGIDPTAFNVNPVEAVCRTIEKLLNLNQIGVDEIVSALSSGFNSSKFLSANQVLIGG